MIDWVYGLSLLWLFVVVFGVALAIPAGVTGAFIATPLGFAAVSLWLALVLRRRLDVSTSGHAARTIRSLVTQGWLPVLGLVLLAVLQNIDVVIARHRFGHDRAGHYAVAAVAAKTVVWVSIGVGLQLLPQAAARATQGLDPRPVLARALAVLGVVTVPALIVFSVAPRLLLKVGFGPDTQDAAPALLVLGVAMACLAVSILTVQFLIALGQPRFPPLLALGATVEIVALATGSFSLAGFARVVAATQVFVAIGSIALAARSATVGAPPPPVPLALEEA